MSVLDIFDIGDVLLSWRFYLGLAATGLVCWLVISMIPHEAIAWLVVVPIGVGGFVCSIRWQHQSDSGQ